MIEFNKNKIMQEKTVVRCNTYDQSINLVKWAKLHDIYYSSIDINEGWDNYKDKLCYNISENSYADTDFYYLKNFNIIEYEDVILKLGKIKKINMWEIDGVEPFRTEEEAILYIRKNEAKEDLIKTLSYQDFTDDQIEYIFKAIAKMPYAFEAFIKEYTKSIKISWNKIKTE